MSSTRPHAPVLTAALAVAGSLAVLLTILLTAAPASAAVTVSGSATISVGTGKPGFMLGKQRVRVAGVSPARTSRNGRISRIAAPVSAVRIAQRSAVDVRGGVRFVRGKRRAAFTRLRLNVTPRRTVVSASLGKRRVVLFAAVGNAVIDPVESKLNLTSARLSLSGAAARLIRGRLRLRRLPAGPFGRLSLTARRTVSVPPVDPYLEQCDLAATSKRISPVAPASPLPVLADPQATGDDVSWSIRNGLNLYVGGVGSIELLGGVTSSVTQPPAGPPVTSFTFPQAPGQYAANDTGTLADDQAVVNGSGTVVYCNKAHGFRAAISNPTVVIDGANSRIIADLDTNIAGVWTPTRRVDFVTLDLSEVTPTSSEPGIVTWPAVPTQLSQTGADALRFCDIPPVPGLPGGGCLYPAGKPFDPITVVATTTG